MDAKDDSHNYHDADFVSIHAPVMDANNRSSFTFLPTGFNPRARDGREAADPNFDVDKLVSIHAPVMDANTYLVVFRIFFRVSIHAPVMDANRSMCF